MPNNPLGMKTRTTLILETDYGQAEAAPLPGYSKETIEDLLAWITKNGLKESPYPSLNFALWYLKESTLHPIQRSFSVKTAYLIHKEPFPKDMPSHIKIKPHLLTKQELDRIISHFGNRVLWRIDMGGKEQKLPVDPSWIEFTEDDPLERPFPRAFDRMKGHGIKIIKPTLDGMPNLKEDVIISSSFESSLGLLQLAYLCHRFYKKKVHGIGTLNFFQDSL